MEKNYSIASDGKPIAQVTQKWLTVRDSYTVDHISSVDPGLVDARPPQLDTASVRVCRWLRDSSRGCGRGR